MIDVPTLVGQRCTLRQLQASDATAMLPHAANPNVIRNMFGGWPTPYLLADAQAWCDGGWRGGGYVWGIEVGGQIIGCCGGSPNEGWLRCNVETGYWIGEPYWRKGIASEALLLISNWIFTNIPEVTRLYAPIFSWNEGSKAVARKCGYALEGVMKQSAIKDGRVIDRHLYAAYRTSWSPRP